MSCGCNKIVRGAVGLAKAALGVDAVPRETSTARREICLACDRSRVVSVGVGKVRQCDECGCVIAAKVKIASERCPLGKWDASS